jgi:3-oxo-5-alpha-steroid 4-dehydrogenase 1
MSELTFYHGLLIGFLIFAAVIFLALLFITAPYGRHTRGGWGPKINPRLGWVIMELPAVLFMAVCFAISDRQSNLVALVFLGLWELHYINRTLIFPFRIRKGAQPMPLLIACSGLVFNLFNGYLNGRYLFSLSPAMPVEWLWDPRFIVGCLIFLAGFTINLQSDDILRHLRKDGQSGYQIPSGGFYRWVSSPNYMGEMIEWGGWAMATWSWCGLAFFVWTVANLLPRALSHHRWYKKQFPDYPPNRRAIVPFIW